MISTTRDRVFTNVSVFQLNLSESAFPSPFFRLDTILFLLFLRQPKLIFFAVTNILVVLRCIIKSYGLALANVGEL